MGTIIIGTHRSLVNGAGLHLNCLPVLSLQAQRLVGHWRAPRPGRAVCSWLVGVACLFGILICSLWLFAKPRVALPESAINLGPGTPGQVLEALVPIENRGWAPLKFSLSASCGGCTVLEPKTGRIWPGSTLRVRVGVALGAEGTRRDVLIKMTSNDPRPAETTFRVVAECPAPVIASPPRVHFGVISVADAPSKVVRVTNATGESIVGSVEWECASPDFTITTKAENADDPGFVVAVQPALARGRHEAVLRLRYPAQNRSVDVPISVEIAGKIRVAPETITVQADRATGEPVDATVLVWRSDGEPLGKLVATEAPPELIIEERTTTGKSGRRLTVRPRSLREFSYPVHVRLRFESEEESVSFTINPLRSG